MIHILLYKLLFVNIFVKSKHTYLRADHQLAEDFLGSYSYFTYVHIEYSYLSAVWIFLARIVNVAC